MGDMDSRGGLFKAVALGRAKTPHFKTSLQVQQLEITLQLWKGELVQRENTCRAGPERYFALLSTRAGRI